MKFVAEIVMKLAKEIVFDVPDEYNIDDVDAESLVLDLIEFGTVEMHPVDDFCDINVNIHAVDNDHFSQWEEEVLDSDIKNSINNLGWNEE